MTPIKMKIFSKTIVTVSLLIGVMVGALPAAAAAPDVENMPLDKAVALADTAYARGQYDLSASIYSDIAAKKGVSKQLYFNLGNACYKGGDTGMAVLYYLRGLRLSPSDSEIKSNLSFLRSYVDDMNHAEAAKKKVDVDRDRPSFWSALYESVAVNHRSNTWGVWAAASFILLLCALGCYLFSSVVTVRKIGFFSGGVFLAGTVLFIVCAFSAAKAWETSDLGVVTAYKSELKATPSAAAGTVGCTLHGGTEMTVTGSRKTADGVWYRVRLNGRTSGWIPAADFTLVNPGEPGGFK